MTASRELRALSKGSPFFNSTLNNFINLMKTVMKFDDDNYWKFEYSLKAEMLFDTT
jgi:hypothetical protein